jgi:prefoldin subunit 5
MQRGVDALSQAEKGIKLLRERLEAIRLEEAELQAERDEITAYLTRLRDAASMLLEPEKRGTP